MTTAELVEAVQQAGGSLTLNGERVQYAIPKPAVWLVDELRQHREEIVALLRQQNKIPTIPDGVRLVRWQPKDPSVAIVHTGVVNDVHKFIGSTLQQLEARLQGKDWLAGNWTIRELLERLEQVGIELELDVGQRN